MITHERMVSVLCGVVLLWVAHAADAADAVESESKKIAAHLEEEPSALWRSVVEIFTISNAPDLISPWQRSGTESSSGSGVVIDGRRILTNAHVVTHAVHVEVKRAGGTQRYVARVAHVDHEADLALLTVEDEEFFDGAPGVPIGSLPRIQAKLQVYGFPIGGETLSVTAGVVSRIEVSSYAHSLANLLSVQIDAALNPGNSGGPAIAEGLLAGIAMSVLEDSNSVGYVVPAPVINHFLEDVEDGRVDGAPGLGIECQALSGMGLRQFAELNPDESGCLVNRVQFGSAAWGAIEVGDVVLEVDGFIIANDLTVQLTDSLRIKWFYLIQRKQVGESVRVRILREGQRIQKTLKAGPMVALVPNLRWLWQPRYFVFAGLEFQPLDLDYLALFEEIPMELGYPSAYGNIATGQRQEVVLLSKVLPHEVNRGYHDWMDAVVTSVNNVPVRSMNHIAELIDKADGRWLIIDTENDLKLVIDLTAAREIHGGILKTYGVTADRSPGL